MRSSAMLLAIAAVALSGAGTLSLTHLSTRLSGPYDVAHVPTGTAARVVALGHRTFLSDLYWLATVQYIGEPKGEDRGWDKLYALVDLVTDLDPRHGYAYQTGGIVLSAAGRIPESNAILAKGIEKGPPLWTFPYYLSFNHWFYLGDYPSAAKFARMAAQKPGASPNISHLAVSLASKSGTPDDAIAVLHALRKETKDPVTAARLDDQLKLAVLERDAQMLERAANRFEAERGRAITSLRELVSAGLVQRLPDDPFGGEYYWSNSEERVHSTENAFRFSAPEQPRTPSFHYRPSEKLLRRMAE